MRYLFVVACLLVLLLGLGFGALNAQAVTIDLYLRAFEIRLGAALLAAVLLGALLGGAVTAIAFALRGRRRRRSGRTMSTRTDSVPTLPSGTA